MSARCRLSFDDPLNGRYQIFGEFLFVKGQYCLNMNRELFSKNKHTAPNVIQRLLVD